MAFYIFASSFGAGLVYSQICDNDIFKELYTGLFKPHRDHRDRLRRAFKKGEAVGHVEYGMYIVDLLCNPYSMVYNLTIARKKQLQLVKQQMVYDLVEKFEMMSETIDNYDDVLEFVKKKQREVPSEFNYAWLSFSEMITKKKDEAQAIDNKFKLLKNLADKDPNTSELEKRLLEYPKFSRDEIPLSYKVDQAAKQNLEIIKAKEELIKLYEEPENILKQKLLDIDQAAAKLDMPKEFKLKKQDELDREEVNRKKMEERFKNFDYEDYNKKLEIAGQENRKNI